VEDNLAQQLYAAYQKTGVKMYRSAGEEILRLRAANEILRTALSPFAYYASQIPDDVSDTASASGTVGDLRVVAAVMKELGE
jgi:hypothetical protein